MRRGREGKYTQRRRDQRRKLMSCWKTFLEEEKEANRAEQSLKATNELTNPPVSGKRGRSWLPTVRDISPAFSITRPESFLKQARARSTSNSENKDQAANFIPASFFSQTRGIQNQKFGTAIVIIYRSTFSLILNTPEVEHIS